MIRFNCYQCDKVRWLFSDSHCLGMHEGGTMSDAVFVRVVNCCMAVGLVAITGGVVGIMAALVARAWSFV